MTQHVPLPNTRTIDQLQTNAPTESDDCTVASSLTVMLDVSHGFVGPRHPSDDEEWVAWFRRLAGKSYGALRIRRNVYRAWRHPDLKRAFSRRGLTPPDVEYVFACPWQEVKRRLMNGWSVLLAVDYGVLRRGHAPIGSLTFNDGHLLPLRHASKDAGRYWTADGDSLLDGRDIPGPTPGNYPEAWVQAKLADFREAAGKFGDPAPGTNKATVIFVRRHI